MQARVAVSLVVPFYNGAQVSTHSSRASARRWPAYRMSLLRSSESTTAAGMTRWLVCWPLGALTFESSGSNSRTPSAGASTVSVAPPASAVAVNFHGGSVANYCITNTFVTRGDASPQMRSPSWQHSSRPVWRQLNLTEAVTPVYDRHFGFSERKWSSGDRIEK